MSEHILAIDQGTTSSRALVFDRSGAVAGAGQQEIAQHYPRDGWVEHDPEEIWRTTLDSCRAALERAGVAADDLACVGITNQRETTVVWDRATGEPVHRAIVWQDRRTADFCREMRDRGLSETVREKTGLLLDPYFSATKLRWILERAPGARARAEAGELAFGTIDSFLLWRLTGGAVHLTDASNAARTLLFNIRSQEWDEDLLELFSIPRAVLPKVMDSAADFGTTDPAVLGAAAPVAGVIGDQQAAAFGQGCFERGMAKCTYGTGAFLLVNTGAEPVMSRNRLLGTVAWRLDGRPTYALEGSIFMAGATVQWLRDKLKLIGSAADSERLAREAADDLGVHLVPAFTGLGAPHWDPGARAAILGMTRDTGAGEIAAAALMSACWQTRDLVDAMAEDGAEARTLRIDGGMAGNDFVAQRLADALGRRVLRPALTETTALGAAFLAGLRAGLFGSLEEIAEKWRPEREFAPEKDEAWRRRAHEGWLDAVRRVRAE